MEDALKAAVSAAAVGAAVGAARAYASQRHEAPGEPEPEPEPEAEEARTPEPPEPQPEPDTPPARGSDLRQIVADARRLLVEVHGEDAESVSGVRPSGGGWTVALEVVEVRRIPDSTDVLASYEVELGGDGGVRRLERMRRYRRSEADGGGRS